MNHLRIIVQKYLEFFYLFSHIWGEHRVCVVNFRFQSEKFGKTANSYTFYPVYINKLTDLQYLHCKPLDVFIYD